jgi:hypothetical protein
MDDVDSRRRRYVATPTATCYRDSAAVAAPTLSLVGTEERKETLMVIVGVDAHKATHTMVAIDDVGRKIGEKTVAANTEGHLDALIWARAAYGAEMRWAVEDCRQVSTLTSSLR